MQTPSAFLKRGECCGPGFYSEWRHRRGSKHDTHPRGVRTPEQSNQGILTIGRGVGGHSERGFGGRDLQALSNNMPAENIATSEVVDGDIKEIRGSLWGRIWC